MTLFIIIADFCLDQNVNRTIYVVDISWRFVEAINK